jgi:hypothetical protein
MVFAVKDFFCFPKKFFYDAALFDIPAHTRSKTIRFPPPRQAMRGTNLLNVPPFFLLAILYVLRYNVRKKETAGLPLTIRELFLDGCDNSEIRR